MRALWIPTARFLTHIRLSKVALVLRIFGYRVTRPCTDILLLSVSESLGELQIYLPNHFLGSLRAPAAID